MQHNKHKTRLKYCTFTDNGYNSFLKIISLQRDEGTRIKL